MSIPLSYTESPHWMSSCLATLSWSSNHLTAREIPCRRPYVPTATWSRSVSKWGKGSSLKPIRVSIDGLRGVEIHLVIICYLHIEVAFVERSNIVFVCVGSPEGSTQLIESAPTFLWRDPTLWVSVGVVTAVLCLQGVRVGLFRQLSEWAISRKQTVIETQL